MDPLSVPFPAAPPRTATADTVLGAASLEALALGDGVAGVGDGVSGVEPGVGDGEPAVALGVGEGELGGGDDGDESPADGLGEAETSPDGTVQTVLVRPTTVEGTERGTADSEPSRLPPTATTARASSTATSTAARRSQRRSR
jgi:hypothetical protein